MKLNMWKKENRLDGKVRKFLVTISDGDYLIIEANHMVKIDDCLKFYLKYTCEPDILTAFVKNWSHVQLVPS